LFHEKNILYEDNHLFIVNKQVAEIVQGDQSGDKSLDLLIREFIKARDNKPGNVFLGIPHRLDRPVSGALIYTKTGKALSRMAQMFKEKAVEKIYHAIVQHPPDPPEGTLEHYISRNTKQNKSYCHDTEREGAKHAVLHYRTVGSSERYHLLEVVLETGRHHQIRAQLASIGCVIRGDKKYGFRRPNRNGGISLHARKVSFHHPVKGDRMEVLAPYPEGDIFGVFEG